VLFFKKIFKNPNNTFVGNFILNRCSSFIDDHITNPSNNVSFTLARGRQMARPVSLSRIA